MSSLRSQNNSQYTQTWRWYLASLVTMNVGLIMAIHYYPGNFDWVYTVASALASQKHNPTGSAWFAASMCVSMLLLWPYITTLKQRTTHTNSTRYAFLALRLGLIGGIILGVERLVIHDLSSWIYKGHELIALTTLLGMYCGVLGLLGNAIHLYRKFHRQLFTTVIIVASPLIVIGVLQLWLYIDQRDLGWVDAGWREKGIPVWLSFAFWQWTGIAMLWTGLASLNLFTPHNKK